MQENGSTGQPSFTHDPDDIGHYGAGEFAGIVA
jgi:hypothetical protein